MYKKLSTLFLFCSALSVQSQMIMGITLVPSSPDDNDTLTFYINSYFPNSGCEGTAVGGITGNDIYASGMHCQGMLTTTCSDIDTVIIPPQPAGNYNFYFTLNAGFGGPPCSPPFTPNDYDTLSFIISPATAVSDLFDAFELSVFPNPSNGNIMLKLDHASNASQAYVVLNEIGDLVLTGNFQQQTSFHLNNGIYIISVPSLGIQQRIVVVK